MRALLCAVLATSAACASSGADQVASPVGCYHLDAGMRSTNIEYQQPTLAYLDSTEVGVVGSRTYHLAEMPGSLPSIHRIAFWRLSGADTLEMVWSTGFAAVILRFPFAAGDTLRGQTIAWNDASIADTLAAVAVRIPCDTPVPASLARRRQPPPAVELVGGESLRIGAPLEVRSVDTLGSGRFVVASEPAGEFAGADSVVVATSREGLVSAIILTFSDDSSFIRSLSYLRGRYGPSFSERGRDTASGTWVDRELWIAATARSASRLPRVVIADPRQ